MAITKSKHKKNFKKHFRWHISIWAVVLAALVAVQCGVMVGFGTQKAGYHADEVYTYGLANTNKKPFLAEEPNYEGNWHGSSYFREYLTTQPEEAFQYDHTYYNQRLDVHPPFYYFIFHTISSFTPNTFTKWTGIITNLIFFVASSVLLWLLARKFFKKGWQTLLPNICWGFSAAAVSSIMYFRMYAMLTCFTLLLTLLDFQIIEQKKIGWRMAVGLSITAFCGFLTHYYFIIYLFTLGVPLLIYLLLKRRKKDLLKCLIGVVGGGAAGILYYPECLKHIFIGYRGKESWERISQSGHWLSRLHNYLSISNSELLGGAFRFFLAAFVILLIVCFVLHYQRKRRTNSSETSITSPAKNVLGKFLNNNKLFVFVQLGIACAVYICIIAKIAPYDVDRYVFPVYPQIELLISFVFWILLGALLHNTRVRCGILAVLFFITGAVGLGKNHVEYLYPDTVQTKQIAQQHANTDCLVVYDKLYYAYTYFLYSDLMYYPKTYLTFTEHLDHLSSELNGNVPKDKPLIVYIATKDANTLKRVVEASNRTKSEKLFSGYHEFSAYRLSN